MDKSDILFLLIASVLAILIGLCAVKIYDPLPLVYWSTSENECVRIQTEGGSFDCSGFNELTKYERIYVK